MPAPLGNHNATKTWDDERDSALRWGLSERMTFTEIAAFLNKRFGTAYTRSAIGGRAWRLDLKASRTGFTELQRHHHLKLLEKGREAMRLKRAKAAAEPAVPVPRTTSQFHRDNLSGLRCAEVEPLNIALVDLEPHHCRWPIGGWPEATPITHCGQPKCHEHESYCFGHWQISLGRGTASEQSAHRVQVA